MHTYLYTLLAMIAFAANSVLCRWALGESAIDAASFSTIRVVSGAIALWLILISKDRGIPKVTGSWTSAIALCLYAIPFSFAYIEMQAGTGALILFGAVQLTMIGAGLWAGERPTPLQWIGFGMAIGGLVYLLLPGLSAPPLASAMMMALAGFGWGVYSLQGKGGENPLLNTTSNFVRSVPIVIIVSLIAMSQFHIEPRGALLAVISGAVTSGLGYAVWYLALRDLTATRAAMVQLSVPIIAALGGVIFLAEAIQPRLVLSALIVLGGVAATLIGKRDSAQP